MADYVGARFWQRAALGLGLLLAAAANWAPAQVIAGERAVGFQTVTSQQLLVMLESKDFVLVNVHIPYEGEIAQTDIFIPFDEIAKDLDRLPADKGAKLILYCRSGSMSEIAATTLAGLGYTNVSHLSGGMIAWQAAGQSLLRE